LVPDPFSASREISIAGSAALSAFGFNPQAGVSGDYENLAQTGLRAEFNGRESAFAADPRKSVEKDIRVHRRFVSVLADELYVHCGEEVSRERIADLWQQHRN
jgi:hypothetical protein